MAQTIFAERPLNVVEFGSGVSSFVIARSLQIIGNGRLLSFDHSESFAEITRRQIAQQGLSATIRVVPLRNAVGTGERGMWYEVDDLPEVIDMIVVDGPPSSVHPETRSGAGSATFANLRKGGVVFLDDACREGERRVVNRWRLDHPAIEFIHLDTAKGTVVGRKIELSACEDMTPDQKFAAHSTAFRDAKRRNRKVGRSDGQSSK